MSELSYQTESYKAPISYIRLSWSKDYYEEKKKEQVKNRLDNIYNLKSINMEMNQLLRIYISSSQEELIERHFKYSVNAFRFIGLPLKLIRGLIYFILSFVLINRLWLNFNHTVPPVTFNFVYFLESLGTVGLLNILYYYTILIPLRKPISSSKVIAFSFLISTVLIPSILLYVILMRAWNYQLKYIAYVFATAILIFTLQFIVSYISLEISFLIYRIHLRRTLAIYPTASIIDKLLSLLLIVESDSGVKRKQELMLGLEEASRCIEYYLPRKLQTRDNSTDAWLKETLKQVATALREKKRWILTPKKDTCDYFLKSIATTLVSIVEDDWDALERMEPEKITRPELLNAIALFLLKASKTILITALPVVGFIVFQQTSFALTGATLVSIISFLFIYIVTAIMAAIDPNFSSKIATASDLKKSFFS